MEEFLMNFKVTRKVQEMNKVGIPGSSYYMDGTDKIPLQVYRYQYYVENIYSIFGHDFVSKKIIYGESVNEDDIPFKKSGKFKTEYSNLTGYETASYFADGRKNIMCKYGKSGVLDLPCNLKDLFNDRDFCLYLYLFYSYIQDRNNISIDTIFDIKRLVQITNEINKKKKERDELLESFEKVLVL